MSNIIKKLENRHSCKKGRKFLLQIYFPKIIPQTVNNLLLFQEVFPEVEKKETPVGRVLYLVVDDTSLLGWALYYWPYL